VKNIINNKNVANHNCLLKSITYIINVNLWYHFYTQLKDS